MQADWEAGENETFDQASFDADWSSFASALGNKELQRLDQLNVSYRLPLPGVRLVWKKSAPNTPLKIEFDKFKAKTDNEELNSDGRKFFYTRKICGCNDIQHQNIYYSAYS